MSFAIAPRTRPRTPCFGPSRSDAPHTHGLLSPAHSNDDRQNAESPFRRFWLDWHELRREHPTRDVGLDILQDLSDVRLTPNAPCPAHRHVDPRCTVDLGQMTRFDIKAVQMDPSLVVCDLRTNTAREEQPLVDGDDVRQAVYSGQPIIFRAEALPNGLRSARLDIPHYITEHLGRTLVGGEGAFYTKLPAYYSDVILTQTVGKCLLVTFPQTPENAALSERVPSPAEQRQWIRWAIRRPAVDLRILLPGDSAFLSRDHIRFAMCLGHGDSRYSATALLYVTHHRVVEHHKLLTHAREARAPKTPKPYERTVSDPRRQSASQAGDRSQPPQLPELPHLPRGQSASLPRGEPSAAARAGYAARASPTTTATNDAVVLGASGRRWLPTNSTDDSNPRLSLHELPNTSRGGLASAARAGISARALLLPSSNFSESSNPQNPRRQTALSVPQGRSRSAGSSGGQASAQTLSVSTGAADESCSGLSIWSRIDQDGLFSRTDY